jgi:glycosyltransferase involved in cell wall biosynthesis
MQSVDKKEWPLVSAIVLSYNQARFAVECLNSIKAQNYPNLELIINDDASKDDSVAVIEQWLAKNPQIPSLFLKSKTNLGICRSLNNAYRQAKGKYMSGIAADDMWLPGKLCYQVELMESLPAKVGLVYSDAMQMDEQGNDLPLKFYEDAGRNRFFSKMPQGDVQVEVWQANFIAPMTTLIRRECFDKVGLYDEDLFAEDWDMWLRISRHYEFVFSPQLSARYRIVGTSATNGNFGRLVDDMCKTCVKHLKAGGLRPGVREAAGRKLHALATSSFWQKTLRHKRNLLGALRYHPSAGGLLRCALACAGLTGAEFERTRAFFCGPRLLAGGPQTLKGKES